MGCDGGTIPKRDELVRTKQKKEQTDKSIELVAKWQFCAISSNKLVEPIVSCELGRLYNKDAVIEYLLDKSSTPNGSLVQHIRSLKDVTPLNLTIKSDYSDKKPEIDGQYVDTQDSKFVCPVVGVEMNGLFTRLSFKNTLIELFSHLKANISSVISGAVVVLSLKGL